MRIGWLDGYEHNHTVYMEVTNTKVQSNARTPMNVHHLELFYYVAKHGGISAAVRRIPYGTSSRPSAASELSPRSKLSSRAWTASRRTKTTALLYNLHALNIIASMNALITSWRAPTSASLLLPSDGFVEGDDIVSSSGYLDASPPIACMVYRSSPTKLCMRKSSWCKIFSLEYLLGT